VALGIAEPKLTISVFSLFGIVSLVIYLFLRKKIDNASKIVMDYSLAEHIDFIAINACIREIKAFNNEEIFLNHFISRIKKTIPKKVFINVSNFIPSWLLEVIGFGTILVSVFWLILTGSEIPQIIASISLLLLTAWRILPIINRAMTSIVSIRGLRQYALICLDLFDELYCIDTKIQQDNIPFNFNNTVSLIDVSFKYPLANNYAIKDISLEISKGETIGLIGPSGSGKSTLALVLSGLVPPIDGRIEVDGKDLTSDRRTALSRQVGFIPQTPVFMDGTVADNVAFSCWGRSYDRQGVVEACKHAAMDFVFENPQGLDLRLSSDGKGLSVGQAQRVAIARALFANPLIIIFDEATSALDQLNENLIQQTMQQMTKDVTKIIIAHRLTTVEICDRLIWLENGRIKEIGPPSIILPLYKCLINIY
jgi:ABC-type multidrug transport system fused ATPase/permease subunit